MGVKESYGARWYLSRNLEDMRQCEGKDIPGTFKRKSQVQRPWGGTWVGPEQKATGRVVGVGWRQVTGGVGASGFYSEWIGSHCRVLSRGGPDLSLEMMTGFLGGEQAMGNKINFQRGVRREGSEEAAKVLLVEKGLPGSRDSSLDGSEWRRSGVLGKFQGQSQEGCT